jgi:DNA polymerase I
MAQSKKPVRKVAPRKPAAKAKAPARKVVAKAAKPVAKKSAKPAAPAKKSAPPAKKSAPPAKTAAKVAAKSAAPAKPTAKSATPAPRTKGAMDAKPGTPRLFAVDTMGVLYRSFFALIRQPMINSKGLNTSGLHGLVQTLFGILNREQPDYLAVVTDTPEPTFRHEKYPDYKATREKMPDELVAQLPYIPRIVNALHLPYIAVPGFEADDIIGTLAKQATVKGWQTFMVTGDKDYMQLIDDNTVMYVSRGEDSTVTSYAGVMEKFGCTPEKVIEVLGLMGDASDHVPGVRGVGPKTATKLIQDYGSIDNLYAHVDEVKGDKLRETLKEQRDQAFLSRELVTIDTKVPLPVKLGDLKVKQLSMENNGPLVDVLTELEFQTLRDRVIKRSGGTSATATETKRAAPTATYVTLDTLDAIRAQAAKWAKAPLLVMDTETTGLDVMASKIVGLSFSIEAGEAFYIPLNHPNLAGHRTEAIDLLRPVLTSAKPPKGGHNMKYDLHMLEGEGVTVGGVANDTMIASHLSEPAERRHDLDSVALRRLGVTKIPTDALIGKGKNEITMDLVPIEKVAEYACEDAEVTYRLTQAFGPRLKELNEEAVFTKLEMPLVPVLMRMERAGVRFDEAGAKKLSKEMAKKLEGVQAQIYKISGESGWNIASIPDLQRILYEKLKLHEKLNVRPKKIKTGMGLSTDEDTLEKMMEHPLPKTLLEFRELTKLKSTYLDQLGDFVNPVTGKIHTSFRQAVAATGRLASDNPNLQNIPIRSEEGRKVRALFIPSDDDHVLMSADYSQIELRVVADFSGDPTFMEAFRTGTDIHRLTAAAIFDVAPDKVDRDMRTVAKEVNFGLIYRMGADRLAQVTGRTKDEAREFIRRFFERYSTIRDLQDELMERARKEGYAETRLGRKRFLPEINGSDGFLQRMAEGAAINTPIQGTAAEIIKQAMINVDARLSEEGLASRMILSVHDELVFDARKDELPALKKLVVAAMESAMKLKVPLLAEVGTGKNWLEAH